MNKNVKYS